MTIIQVFFPENNILPFLSRQLFDRFPYITSDPTIHSGWPHIKGTRILASDILRGIIQGYSLETMIMQFKEMGIKVSKEALIEACKFTVEWMYLLNEKKTSKTPR